MVDAVVSFAIETLGNFLVEDGQFLYGVKGQVEEMQTELKWMQGFLKDAEARKGESYLVRNWVSEIREATYDIEDLIESFILKSALRNRKGVVNRIKKYTGLMYLPVELHQVGSRIKAINAGLTTLTTKLQNYGIREVKVGGKEVAADGASATATRRRKRQDYSHVVDHNVVGLDEKITELVERLIRGQHNDDDHCPVVCLHGMGGVGKTTAAKKVYGDSRIRSHFEGFAWVYISEQCNPRQVWESILTQLSEIKKDIKYMPDDELASKLYGIQKDKRCLLVIDDIWNNQDWDNISVAFPYMEDDSKSKMLLTTRNEGVVSNGLHVYPTNLSVLDDDKSWLLLKKTIISLGGPKHPITKDSNMEKCAGEMVKQCGGLPLAIIVLGGILATKHELIKWEANMKMVLKRGEREGNDGVMSVLESSYKDLPYNLRSCFLYFSRYPEDAEIKTTGLKQKWIGEGFVSPSAVEGDETMEDIAEEYLHELVRRCMIQVGRRGHSGRVKTCRIHDLMRDLSVSKAREEGFAHTIKLGAESEGTNLKKVSSRRLCISSGNHELGESVVSSLKRISPQLRSLWFQDNLDDEQCKEAVLIVKKLKLVRVLELPSAMWTLMGKSGREEVGNLIHLRFLNLEVSMLPASIGNLICVQTLNLGRCNSNLIIPDSVWQVVQLRHLYLPKDGGVCESAKQLVGDFPNLQTLVNFPPRNFDLEQNLVKFINVRKLGITNRCEEICKILQSEVMEFNRLESLSFTDSSENVDLEAVTGSCPCLYRLVVNAPIKFTPIWPSNLTKLVLRCYGLDITHIRSLGKLPSLKVLFLYDDSFRGERMMFYENEFPQLHHLLVEELSNLLSWGVHEGGLPSLCCLEIVNCRRLKSVLDGFQYLKQLKELKVTSMPYVFRKKLEKGGEDWYRVRHVPSISFSHCYRESSSNILDESSSLELFKKTILSSGGPNHPIRENSKMDVCAIEMVKICGGVATVITILGGLLARKLEIEEWESIKSVLKEGNDLVASLLEFSYEDLPRNLKPCFLYFGQYVKDEEINTTEIIQRWIGEGFITDETMADVAQEHLNELLSRCLIQVGERSHRGRVKTYRVHEFVWHFCVSKAKEEGFALSLHQLGGIGDEGTIMEKVKFRRLCIYPCRNMFGGSIISSSLVEIIPQLVSVRFPYNLGDEEQGKAVVLMVKNLKSVKVLSLPRIIWNLLDESGRERIGNLVHLTFLKLGGSELPKSLGNLRCLQTLKLETCGPCPTIPDSVWGMGQLRHLYLPKERCKCETITQRVGDFPNLLTLVNFPPLYFDLEQNLVKFTGVRKLVISRWVGRICSILRSQRIVFKRLQSLSFDGYSTYVDLEAFTRACPGLYRLCFRGPIAPSCTAIWPSNLTKLVLRRTEIDQSQLGSLAKLQSLQVLFLCNKSFLEKEMVFHKNDLPQLHHLRIEHLEHLETWAIHEGALPNLLCLEIVDCRKLKSVLDGFQHLNHLKELKVRDMSHSFKWRLEEGREDCDRVSDVPNISFIGCNCDRCTTEAEKETKAEEETDAERQEMVFYKNYLPQLRHLRIERLEHLETWAVHEGALPNLLCLEIVDCPALKSIGDGAQYLKQLNELKFKDMPSGFRERLEGGGEDWDRVSHVPSISFINCD